MIAVESVESFFCAEPEEALLILCAAEYGAVGKSILHLEMSEVIRLSVCPGEADNEQQGRYGRVSQMKHFAKIMIRSESAASCITSTLHADKIRNSLRKNPCKRLQP